MIRIEAADGKKETSKKSDAKLTILIKDVNNFKPKLKIDVIGKGVIKQGNKSRFFYKIFMTSSTVGLKIRTRWLYWTSTEYSHLFRIFEPTYLILIKKIYSFDFNKRMYYFFELQYVPYLVTKSIYINNIINKISKKDPLKKLNNLMNT